MSEIPGFDSISYGESVGKAREAKRATILERLSGREQQLVREVAISAFVMGMMHVNPHLRQEDVPDDAIMFNIAIENAYKFPEIYPVLTNSSESPEQSTQE
jgi:hypothetical protein